MAKKERCPNCGGWLPDGVHAASVRVSSRMAQPPAPKADAGVGRMRRPITSPSSVRMQSWLSRWWRSSPILSLAGLRGVRH